MADVIITPASGLIDFQNTSGISSATIQLNGSGDLIIGAAAGDIQIGDTSGDIFVGDGVNNVDIVFEQDGEIRGDTGVTVTLGQSDSYIKINAGLKDSNGVVGAAGSVLSSDGSLVEWVTPQSGAQGLQGLQGSGSQGTQGVQGRQGTQGLSNQGVQGTQGLQGLQGSGSQGTQGLQGRQGTQGLQGLQGSGSQGTQGLQGRQGTQGLSNQGVQGTQGLQGLQGSGSQGTQGLQGRQGTQGTQGLQGRQGTQGTQGLQGRQGTQGTQGLQGITGPIAGTNSQVIFNNNNVSAGATNFVYIATTQNVGIGTTNPQSALDVRGTISIGRTDASTVNSIRSVTDINSWEYGGVSLAVGGQDTSPQDIYFKDDGTKMFILGDTGNDVNEYALSTAWEVNTATFTTNFSFASQETAPLGLYFKPDGTRMYICGQTGVSPTGDYARSYTLSTPWDISTASYDSILFDVGAQDTVPQGIYLSDDGSKMYIAGSTNDRIYEYSLGTNWDVSTATFITFINVGTSNTLNLPLSITAPTGIDFNSSGTKMYITGSGRDTVARFDLSTPWDISTATFYDNVYVGFQELAPNGIFYQEGQSKAYIVGSSSDTVFQYNTDVPSLELASSGITTRSSVIINNEARLNNRLYVTGDTHISGNTNVKGTLTADGTINAATLNITSAIDLADNDILRFGSSDDWEFFHDGTHNYMDLNVGNLIIRDNTTTRFTFERTTGNFLLGSSSSTGTASQLLQVTGGAYISGNLGVGNTNPQNPLHISGSPGTLLRLDGGGAGTGTRDIVITEFDTTAYGGIIRYDSTLDTFTLGTLENSVVQYALNIARTTGNVGVGYTQLNTTVKLAVAGTTLINTNTLTGTASQALQVSGGAYVSGNIGVGTTNPTRTLDVNGDLRLRGGLYVGSANTSGTSGQILQSTGIGVTWVSSSGGGTSWVKKTTTYTAVNGDKIIADTSGGSFTITLPATPTTGNSVIVADGDDWNTNNLTIGRNGSTIEGLSDNFVLDIKGITVEFIYDGTTWELFANSGPVMNAPRRSQSYSATSNQTTFTVTNGYTPGYIDVYLNGSKLQQSAEFTATDGSTFVLSTGASLNDIVDVVAFDMGVNTNPNYTTTRLVTRTVATASQTSFSVSYDVGYVDVYLNGSKLDSTEFTATTGSTVVLTTAATENDVLEFISYATLSVNTLDTTVVNETTNATRYITFTDVTSGSISTARVSSSGLTFNPSTGVFTTQNINATKLTLTQGINATGIVTASGGFVGNVTGNVTGNLTGTASNATSATSATSAGTATNANNVNVSNESSDTTCFPVFVTTATGDQAPKTNTGFYFNSATGTLYATQFSGDGSLLTGITASDVTLDAMLFGA